MKRPTAKPQPETYERPSLKVLGTARELTQGLVGGPNPDATFPIHTSA